MKLNILIILLISLSACDNNCAPKLGTKKSDTKKDNEQIQEQIKKKDEKNKQASLDQTEKNKEKISKSASPSEKASKATSKLGNASQKTTSEIAPTPDSSTKAEIPVNKQAPLDQAEKNKQEALKEFNNIPFYEGSIIRHQLSDEHLNNTLNKLKNLSFKQQNPETKNAIKTLKNEKKSREYIQAKKDELLKEFSDFKSYLSKYNDDIFGNAKKEFSDTFDIDNEEQKLRSFGHIPAMPGPITTTNNITSRSVEYIKNTFDDFIKAKENFKNSVRKIIINKIKEENENQNYINLLCELGSKQLREAVEDLINITEKTANINNIIRAINAEIDNKKELFNNKIKNIIKNKESFKNFLKNNEDKEYTNTIFSEHEKLDKREEALEQLKIAINTKDEDEKTLAHKAAVEGNGDVLTFLATIGADLYAIDKEDNTPLHLAAQNANKRATLILINHYKDNIKNIINNQNIDKKTPLHLAIASKKTNRFEIEDIIEKLINNGANVNLQDSNGNTPLHAAAKLNKEEIVKMLLDHGADKNITNIDENTPEDLTNNEAIKNMINNYKN